MNKPEAPIPLNASAVFGLRMQQARASKGKMTQQQLSDGLAEVGVKLHRAAVAEIERGVRQVSLEEAYAIAWTLQVFPLFLMTPFEDPEPVVAEDGGKTYHSQQSLRVLEDVVMPPFEARAWIAGQGWRDTGLDDAELTRLYLRVYVDEVPEPVKKEGGMSLAHGIRTLLRGEGIEDVLRARRMRKQKNKDQQEEES